MGSSRRPDSKTFLLLVPQHSRELLRSSEVCFDYTRYPRVCFGWRAVEHAVGRPFWELPRAAATLFFVTQRSTPLSYLVETIHTCQDTASSSSTDTATRYGSDRGHLGGAGGHLEQYGRRDGRPGREGSPIIATSLLLRRRELCHR